ncbi:MAG: DUF2219 domain-containing protein [Alcanivorax sp.]|nr:DUF2219 domain-containing protein [Alcanivorax sp.]
MHRIRIGPASASLCLLLASLSAQAGVLNIAWDNDLLTGEDKGYTNGVRISYLSGTAERNDTCRLCLPRRARDSFGWLPGIGNPDRDHALSVSLIQLMVTPEDIEAEAPQFDDVPYVGLAAIETTLFSWNRQHLVGYGLLVGHTGPDSGAKRSQEWVHKVTGSSNPKGWDNQLGPDVVGGLHALYANRFYSSGANGLQNELVWSAGTRLSTFITSAETGLFWRIGHNLPGNFVPEYAGLSSTIGLPGLLDIPGPGWSLFAGLSGEGIAYNYIEDRGSDYAFRQRHFIGGLSLGGSVHTESFQFALTLRATTSPTETNKDPMSFGTLSFTWRL